MGGRVWILWLRVLQISPLMKGRGREMGWSMVAKSKAWLGAGAVRICRVHNWKLGGDSWGDQVWSFLLNSSYCTIINLFTFIVTLLLILYTDTVWLVWIKFSKLSGSQVNLPSLSVCICSDCIIAILGLPESAFFAMLILCLMTVHCLYLRVRTVQQCVLLVYMDQAACPPAPAIITHPALQSTAPASAEKVQYNWVTVQSNSWAL